MCYGFNLDFQPSPASSNFPVSSLPILAACSSSFSEMIDLTITRANTIYREFLHSEVGNSFNGEVSYLCFNFCWCCVGCGDGENDGSSLVLVLIVMLAAGGDSLGIDHSWW